MRMTMINCENKNCIIRVLIATLLALTLVATPLFSCYGEDEPVLPRNTQQDRIIAHAVSHQNQKFKKIADRNKGLKISEGTPWCAWFIEHCSYRCSLGSIIPSKSRADLNVGALAKDLVNNKKATITFVNKKVWDKKKGDYKKSRRSYNKNYKPKKGDIIFYANYQISGSYGFSHVGFVYEDCDKALKGVKTIEGNTMASNERKWERTSIVGVRSNANDTNKERRIVAYITPNYCKHKNVDEETGICKNSKCKAQVFEVIPEDDDNTDTDNQ